MVIAASERADRQVLIDNFCGSGASAELLLLVALTSVMTALVLAGGDGGAF